MLVTGGTGSFGRAFTRAVLETTGVRRVIIFSRDELKQWEIRQQHPDEDRLRFFIGDVRDHARLLRAFDGVDIVVHAAALKQVVATEYNPMEAVKTNIHGAQNVIEAAIDRDVERVVALSTDKACSPTNLYGATKLVSDKLFVHGNSYVGAHRTRFSVVRYGNVFGSRGSVLPVFQRHAEAGVLPITDERMTRFWISLDQAAVFVLACLGSMEGGEVFVPKLPSFRIVDLARAVAPRAELAVIGIQPGEKLHEELISAHDARRSVDAGRCYVVRPGAGPTGALNGWAPLPDGFSYRSDTNPEWIGTDELREAIGRV